MKQKHASDKYLWKGRGGGFEPRLHLCLAPPPPATWLCLFSLKVSETRVCCAPHPRVPAPSRRVTLKINAVVGMWGW